MTRTVPGHLQKLCRLYFSICYTVWRLRAQAFAMASPQCDRELKLVLVGDSGAGKTSILRMLTDAEISELYTPTTG